MMVDFKSCALKTSTMRSGHFVTQKAAKSAVFSYVQKVQKSNVYKLYFEYAIFSEGRSIKGVSTRSLRDRKDFKPAQGGLFFHSATPSYNSKAAFGASMYYIFVDHVFIHRAFCRFDSPIYSSMFLL